MNFYLGTHMPNWLETVVVPLFVSRRRLLDKKAAPVELLESPRWEPGLYAELELRAEAEARSLRKRLPVAVAAWALDSGGFTELNLYGEWRTTEDQYVADVRRIQDEIGNLEWVAPMDWMCEPFVLAKTGQTVDQHQTHTVANFLRLREQLGPLVVPVLQGWTLDDYARCWELYGRVGFDLEAEPLVGLGSVCRRQNTADAGRIVRSLTPLRLHYFGAKLTGLESFGDQLVSADSMAWSYAARRDAPLPGCSHKSCANCVRYAMRWRTRLMTRLDQQRLEVAV